MFLKSLTLKGFKSFADSTVLELQPGITVVVGPNGSGKSNLVDAVAWVLGAQGPRAVRSSRMDDVIFAGTPKRAALGRAEVTLTIDNSAGLLPIDFSEVTIARTLFRNGDSEYALNRVPCRLLDIQELLSDSGVGRQQHVIVSQGNLDAVLSARPEDRRLVIEEAAGILKFRRRKEKAERKLEATEASLVRLGDLMREVRRQLRPLEQQAAAARRHRDLLGELTALRKHLAGRELAGAQARLALSRRAGEEASQLEDEVLSDLRSIDSEVAAEEAAGQWGRGAGEREVDLGDLVARADRLSERASSLLAVLAERRRSLASRLSARLDEDVVSNLESEAASWTRQLEGAEVAARALLPEEAALQAAEAAFATEHDRAGPMAPGVEPEGQEQEAPSPRPASGVSAGAEYAKTRAEVAGLTGSLERSEAEVADLAGRMRRVGERREVLAGEARQLVLDADDDNDVLARAADEARQALALAQTARTRAEEDYREADGAHQRAAARREVLAEALQAAEAATCAARLANVPGVLGVLLELVEVDLGWEDAFEAAAGELLGAVVVESPEAAMASLSELRRQGATGSVAPIAAPKSKAPDTGDVRAHARGRTKAIDDLLDDLLGGISVAVTWEEAARLATARPEAIVVSREGDRFAKGVWRTATATATATAPVAAAPQPEPRNSGPWPDHGRTGRGATGGALEAAQVAEREAGLAADQARKARDAANQDLEQAHKRSDEASRIHSDHLASATSARHARERLQREVAAAETEAETLAARHADATARQKAELSRLHHLHHLLPSLEQAVADEENRTAAARAADAERSERRSALATIRRDLEVRAAALEERRTLCTRRLHEIDARLAAAGAAREEAAQRRQELEVLSHRVELLGAAARTQLERCRAAGQRLRAARQVQAAQARRRLEHLEELRSARQALERRLFEAREQGNRAGVEEAEARVRLEALAEMVRRELDCEPEETLDSPCPPLAAGTTAAGRRTELERELRMMGPVNPLAVEEHSALSERHEFLTNQLEDVRGARRELGKVIRAVDAEMSDVLLAAYADVSDNFEALFASLFPGGEGRLRLTDPDHILETGIEVEARPSGKLVRRLSLLSGGERSLVALAFLFAVFRSRPSPFYLLDEVEAALDDVNLQRFLTLLGDFRHEAQLLVVTHQKRTMEAGDCLYGVSMPPGGSSRVIAERVRDTAAV